MVEVITIVTGNVPEDRLAELERAYRELMRDGVPPMLEDSFLLRANDGRVAIASLWRRRADLDAMLASGEEPPARRLIRTHGGEPEVTLWEPLVRASELG
ncbi:MAG TPA: hypothetical protein VF365_11350 [Candidatus Limnocylindria bacterium]